MGSEVQSMYLKPKRSVAKDFAQDSIAWIVAYFYLCKQLIIFIIFYKTSSWFGATWPFSVEDIFMVLSSLSPVDAPPIIFRL